MMRGRHNWRHNSIRTQMIQFIWVCIVPFIILFLMAIYSMFSYSREYNRLVTNITDANKYNLSFKTDMDEMMYQIIIGSANWTDADEKLEGVDPKGLIEEARQHFTELRSTTYGTQVRADLDALIKLLDILDNRVDDILDNVEEGGHYEENIDMLDMNIRTLTDLVQSDIQTYIYDEVTTMESIRQQVSDNLMFTTRCLVGLLIAMLVLSVLVSRTLARRLTQPITDLCAVTQRFSAGDFDTEYHTKSSAEMETLAESFNVMGREIQQLINDINTEQRNAKDAELRLLQEQINPHFLYNTLDTIVWMIEAGDNRQAIRMVQELSNFFRTTLQKGRDLIKVSEEEAHIRSYLEIQQFRYQDILEYELHFDPDVLNCQIQKLTLQPLVENALYHGIKNKRGKGTITVSATRQADELVFTVRDNGIGMQADELARVRAAIDSDTVDPGESGFGMSNVQRRIRMQFGDEYGVTVDSTYMEGTAITVRIPATEWEAAS